MPGIQLPVLLFKLAVFQHVGFPLHFLRHGAGRHGGPFRNRLAYHFLVFLQPRAVFLGKLFQRHGDGLFGRSYQLDGLHVQGNRTCLHRTARAFIRPNAEGRILRRSGSVRKTEGGTRYECGHQQNTPGGKFHAHNADILLLTFHVEKLIPKSALPARAQDRGAGLPRRRRRRHGTVRCGKASPPA